MLHYIAKKLTVYVEPTVVSYLVAQLSPDVTLASWQRATRQEFQMKETQEEYTNPILEECYRIKAEINAEFNSMEEFSASLKAQQEEDKRQGWKYVSFFDPSKYTPPEESTNDSRKTP